MNRDDKVMVIVGITFAFLGTVAPMAALLGVHVPHLHHVLVVATAISSVCCFTVLVRGAFPRLRGK